MKTKLTFISASAGSGKTYRVTEIIEERLANGRCRPGGLIATTYTVKAAKELRERLRQRLYDKKHNLLVERLDEGLIGTVHSVCSQLLARFAFEAGISPRLEVVAEEQAAVLLSQALELVTDFPTLQRLQKIAGQLGQQDTRTYDFNWKSQVKSIIAAAQVNDIAADALLPMAELSVRELTAFFPPPAANDLDAGLLQAITTSIKDISANGDATKGTKDYLQMLRDARRELTSGGLPWSGWVKLSKAQPTKASLGDAAPVANIAVQFESHPRLREHIHEYTVTLFGLAQRSLAAYRQLKEERGILDFADLEQRAIHLLRDVPAVKEILQEELDLLVVDEFQDTSPIQLGLFMELAACAKETIWVGDVKQAIYGFRNSDPALINAVVAEVKKSGGLVDPLGNSYRSVPDLVRLSNALFAPAFAQSLGLAENQVCLTANRETIQPAQNALEMLDLSSGVTNKTNSKHKKLTSDQFAATLAERVTQWLSAPKRMQVLDKEARPLEMRDIAVLCRTNNDAANLAGCLSARGVPVNLSQCGLLATAEARLALACLRRLADPDDTLATAEVIALQATNPPEEWVAQRLDYVAQHSGGADRWGIEKPHEYAAVKALEAVRPSLIALSPREALEAALLAANVFATVSSWGPNFSRAAQRRANLESLRALAQQYEEVCATNHQSATVAGFLFWCDDLAGDEGDTKGSDDQVNAVHVSTYHKAKGLEWPVVVCTGFDDASKPRLWALTVVAVDEAKPFDLNNPLANRRLRFWVWPFANQDKGIPLSDRIDASPAGQDANRLAAQEELRLLYVGLTRARDLLVIAKDEALSHPWLDLLAAGWFSTGKGHLLLPDKTAMPLNRVTVMPPQAVAAPAPETSYAWFPVPITRTAKEPASLIPSHQPALATASIGRVIEFRARLPFSGKPDETDFGDALHGILAAELFSPKSPEPARHRTKDIAGI
jgi:ATP-dependent helicase/nuclease subunit A